MRYCFYSGYKNLIGGYTTLLITLIRELCGQEEKVVLFNFHDGIIARELGGIPGLQIVDIDKVSKNDIAKILLPTDLFILTRFYEFHAVFFKANPRVIYYDINDYITLISKYKFNVKLSFLGKRLVRKLLSANSLFFMDDTGIFNLESGFGLQVTNPVFLPIPVQANNNNEFAERFHGNDDHIRLTYIGRSVDWKMYPLKKILDDCESAQIDRPILFSVVVDSVQEMRKFIDVEAIAKRGKLRLQIFENITPSGIPAFLHEHAHIHFSMGTAALDAAKLGIPTVLVDYATKPFEKNYSYTWLYETKNFSLGRNLDKMNSNAGIPMNTILQTLNDPGALRLRSEQCYQYVQQYHEVKAIVYKLREKQSFAGFRMRAAKPYIPFYFALHRLLKVILHSRTH